VVKCFNKVDKGQFMPLRFVLSASGFLYLALINRAGGLYGRILTEVVSTDRGQDSPIQTDLARLMRCLLYGKEENFNSFNVTGLLTFCLRTAMSLT